MDRLELLENQVIALTQDVWNLAEALKQSKMVETIPVSSRRHKKSGPITDITYVSYCSRLRKYREEFKQTGHHHWMKEVEALEDRILSAGRELPPENGAVEVIPTVSAKAAEASESALADVIASMSQEEMKEKVLQMRREADAKRLADGKDIPA
jgi:uncharacterized protein YciI